MDKLRYKTFTWPENPEHYRVENTRKAVYGENEAGAYFAGLGPRQRTVTGSGCFQGSGAYNSYKALEKLTEQATAGPLVHPVWGTVTAYLTELTLDMEPKADYVAYSFVFRVPDENGTIPK